jgi:DnaJ-class molecular chaperone
MYVGLGALAWTFLRRYWNRQKAEPKHAPIVEDGVVPGIDRKGDDAYCRVSLSAEEAKAGRSMEVPSIDGRQRIDVPAGVAEGAKLRLAGLGFRQPDGKRGDQYVIVSILG